MKQLYLKKGEEKRLKAGHLWIFSNEVDTARSPLKAFEPGENAVVLDAGKRPLGTAYVNPQALICARMTSGSAKQALDEALLRERISDALHLRQAIYTKPFYRLVYGESDFLPGLIVDRFGSILSVQTTTVGMEVRIPGILQILDELLSPAGIVLKNDLAVRELEGLERYVRAEKGDVPQTVDVEENGLIFTAPLAEGQKTGWFYDQRDNRRLFAKGAAGKQVLDGFSYVGGFGLNAAAQGAEEVLCVDSSTAALEYVQRNAHNQGTGGRVSTRRDEMDVALDDLLQQGRRFDLVVLDPPAFIKRKGDKGKGTAAYARIFGKGMRLTSKDGCMLACSCSYHLHRDDMRKCLQSAAQKVGVRVQVLSITGHASDHPLHPAMPETEYLKGFFLRVLK